MKETELSRLSGRYLAALRTHVGPGPQAGLQAALDLGSEAVAIGLETLDLAKMHNQALFLLGLPDCTASGRNDMGARAEIFFTEAVTPIEKTHRFALQASADLNQLTATLDQRTLDLADSNRELQEGITERKTTEAALKASEEHFTQLLKESRLLEEHLQDMTRKILSANEEERKKMSLQLQEEIAQTLLGIHVRLLALKTEAAANHAGLTKEIATTQRLVEASVKTINRLAREFGVPHET